MGLVLDDRSAEEPRIIVMVEHGFFVLVLGELGTLVGGVIDEVIHGVEGLVPVEEGGPPPEPVRSRARDSAHDHAARVPVFRLELVGQNPKLLNGVRRDGGPGDVGAHPFVGDAVEEDLFVPPRHRVRTDGLSSDLANLNARLEDDQGREVPVEERYVVDLLTVDDARDLGFGDLDQRSGGRHCELLMKGQGLQGEIDRQPCAHAEDHPALRMGRETRERHFHLVGPRLDPGNDVRPVGPAEGAVEIARLRVPDADLYSGQGVALLVRDRAFQSDQSRLGERTSAHHEDGHGTQDELSESCLCP